MNKGPYISIGISKGIWCRLIIINLNITTTSLIRLSVISWAHITDPRTRLTATFSSQLLLLQIEVKFLDEKDINGTDYTSSRSQISR